MTRRWVYRQTVCSPEFRDQEEHVPGNPVKKNNKRPAANLGNTCKKSSVSHFRRRNHLRTQLLFFAPEHQG